MAPSTGVYVISVAAQLCGVHPQTLRGWEAAGLIAPARTAGRARRYSEADVRRLRTIVSLSARGIPLGAISYILELEDENDRLRDELVQLRAALEVARVASRRVPAAATHARPS